MGHDVIVVGGGPGGAIAARVAAGKGLSTLLVEKEKFTREKPCAGGVTKKVTLKFDLPKRVLETFERPICGMFVCSPSYDSVTIDADESLGGLVFRSKFDSALVEWANDKGAETKEKTRVVDLLLKDNYVRGIRAKSDRGIEDIESKIVIGADGAYLFIARKLNLFQRRIDRVAAQLTYHMKMPESEIDEKIGNRIEMYFGTKISPTSYAWIFPKRDFVTVGTGSLLSEIARDRIRLKQRLDEFIKHHPVASRKLEHARVSLTQASIITYPGTSSRTYSNGVMLVGDAAGHAVMVSGEGIYYAMVTGKLAAETAIKAIERNDTREQTLQEYEKAWKSEIGRDLDLGIGLREMVTDAKREEMIRNIKEDKRMRELLLDIFAGGKPISESFGL